MVPFACSPETGTAAQVEPSLVVGVTHEQTCLILGSRLRTLREAGFRITLVSGPGELLRRTAERTQVEVVGMPMCRGIAPLADIVSLVRLWRLLNRLRPEIVEFSTPKAGLLGMLASRACRVPVRVYLLRGLKLETAYGLKRRILLAAERLAAACSTVVLCNSGSLRAKALELGVAPVQKLQLLGEGSSNGVDTERFAPGESDVRQQLELPADALVIGFVGRLTRDKGLPELVEAFERIAMKDSRAHLLLVGWFDAAEDAVGGSLRARIEAHARIHCVGFVEDTVPYYRAMDVLVLPTWREGFPNAVLEAEATGIPVITTISTGARDSVVPEVTGLLIPPGYPAAIEEAALKLLRDGDRRRQMGAAARGWVREHYADRDVLGRTAEFYKRLLVEADQALLASVENKSG